MTQTGRVCDAGGEAVQVLAVPGGRSGGVVGREAQLGGGDIMAFLSSEGEGARVLETLKPCKGLSGMGLGEEVTRRQMGLFVVWLLNISVWVRQALIAK